jgi:hypothetical protein
MHRGDLALDVDTEFCKNLPKQKTQHGDLSLEVFTSREESRPNNIHNNKCNSKVRKRRKGKGASY